MKNFKKVLAELKATSPNFYVGGSLSLYVFHYITRTPKDLDIQSTDPVFLEMAKQMQELCPVPEDNRGGWINTKRGSRFSPDLHKLGAKTSSERRPQRYASFMLYGVKIEVFNNRVKKHHIVHSYNFVDPNEVLFYKNQYRFLKRTKDIQDTIELWRFLYPEKASKYEEGEIGDIDVEYLFLRNFKCNKSGYAWNDLPNHVVTQVLSGYLKPRALTGYGNDLKEARVHRKKFLEALNKPKKPVEMPAYDRYLSSEPKKISENKFKLYGYPQLLPAVTLYKKYVLIVNEWGHKVRLSREAFESLGQVPPRDDVPPSELKVKKLSAIKTKLPGKHLNLPVVTFYPNCIAIQNERGDRLKLERPTFAMLKTVNYQMI